MRRFLVALPLLLLSACSPGGAESAEPGAAVDERELLELIYWERIWDPPYPAPAARLGLLERVLAARDERFTPYLVDLAALSTPFRARIIESLTEWRGPTDRLYVFEWSEELGARGPEDDSAVYLEFKQRLLTTVNPEIGAFLDDAEHRRISAQEVFWGGVAVDGIPPLESPRFVSPEQAAVWIGPGDRVAGVEINGDARAYPLRIIDWHEMVNDTVGGVPVSLAYCTLCGSAILYDGRIGNEVFRFGTSGMLYRSNKLMYDRTTRTLWEQYTGVPVWGELASSDLQLDILPVVHTTWEAWLAEHPDTTVLDINTGHVRDYSPGAAYGDYFGSTRLWFPVPYHDGPLEDKTVVYAVRLGGETVAFPIGELSERGLLQAEVADTDVVVLVTPDLSGGRAYNAAGLTFDSFDRTTGVAVSSDGRRWTATEDALLGDDGIRLARLPGHNSYWFSVINHTENGRIYSE